ncbi:MAG TPA: hypothetical protein VJ779_17560 [Acetobacteraceae bacterium]|jgi:hypothetical protein|nr:hypothetical protein [Acetobacteraceae bacterium]
MPNDPEPPPADLSRAGAVVDKAIQYMATQNVSELAIASALLGGALALLSRSMADEAIVRILGNAIESVRNGELRREDASAGDDPAS